MILRWGRLLLLTAGSSAASPLDDHVEFVIGAFSRAAQRASHARASTDDRTGFGACARAIGESGLYEKAGRYYCCQIMSYRGRRSVVKEYDMSVPYGLSTLTSPRGVSRRLSMEILIRFFDDAEDVIVTTAFRLRRTMAWQPRERRRVARLRSKASSPSAKAAQQRRFQSGSRQMPEALQAVNHRSARADSTRVKDCY